MNRAIVHALLSCVFWASTALAHECPPATARPTRDHARRAGHSGLINPLLDVESDLDFSEMRPFAHKVEDLIKLHKSSKAVDSISLYFRDLNNGPLFGIDSYSKFAPASLLKVPVMLAVLKAAQDDPRFLGQSVRYFGQNEVVPEISTGTLRIGEVYTVADLLKAMIVNSDNGAAILLREVTPQSMEQVYADLGMSIPNVRTPDEHMTVREYGTFFRVLYNASYLDRAKSQLALELLAASEFRRGLVAGVPEGIAVAHKFGERYNFGNSARQLHDCGIVYYPGRPYLLCVMTRGDNYDKLTTAIRDISKLVYTEVDAHSKSWE